MLLAKFTTLAALPFDLDSGPGLVCKCATAITLAIVSWYIFEKPILAFKRYFELRGQPRGFSLLAKR
jgi:peptidoglycan/LPS O-acetylase OafA/YrhL